MKLLSVTGNFFLWQDISSCNKKCPPATRNFFLWQEISSINYRFLSVTSNFFLRQLITCSAKMSLHVTRKFSCILCVIERIPSFDRKYGNTLKSNSRQNSVNSWKNFVWAWIFRGSLAPWLPGNFPPGDPHSLRWALPSELSLGVYIGVTFHRLG